MAASGSKKQIEKIVKQEVKKEEKKQHKHEKKKDNQPYKKMKQEIKKQVKKEEAGPKPKFAVTVTATLGQIDGNREHGPLNKLASFLHPSLCKGPDDDKAFGPLQAAAAQYAMWRCTKCHIRFTPLVGGSAVSGTVVRASANLLQTPGSNNWGGLGARKHRDFQAGKSGSFMLTRRDLAGPRQGGWWVTDTNIEGNQSVGPVLEVHALGTTKSTYQDRDWEGPLFIVELTGRWEFTNYNNNPAMGALERHESDETGLKLTTDSEGVIQLKIPSQSALARFMNDPTAHHRAGNAQANVGEIIYQVVDNGAGLVAAAAPPPFNWLIKGGWWFLKKVIGRAGRDTGEETYNIYPSLADAQNNKPAISTQASMPGTAVSSRIQVTQINAPNMGGATVTSQVRSGGSSFPIRPEGSPPNNFKVLANLHLVYHHNLGSHATVAAYFCEAASFNQGGVGVWFPAIHWSVTDPVFFSTQGNTLTSWATAPTARIGQLSLDARCLEPKPTGREFLVDVFGHVAEPLGVTGGEPVYLHTVLWKPHDNSATWTTPPRYGISLLGRSTLTPEMVVLNQEGNISTVAPLSGWYVSQFLVKGAAQWSQIKTGGRVVNGNITPSTDSQMSTLLPFMVQKPDDVTEYVFHLVGASQPKKTKLERLAEALGVCLDDSSDDEYITDPDPDPESSDTESEDDFEQVTDTTMQQRVENLMAAGLSAEQAKKLAKEIV